jgi:hypothetical protein
VHFYGTKNCNMECFWEKALQSTKEEEEEELWALQSSMNEVSFRARPDHNVYCTLGVDSKVQYFG